ncbi:MAG: M42 family metallopeptidase [Clostridia bacterium]|nr:M42 family metallopeptidase [Clostridia bacterium]
MHTIDVNRVLDHLRQLVAIPSPTGYTDGLSRHLMDTLAGYGFSPIRSRKGTVSCTLMDKGARHTVLSAHVDTLGLMVREITETGRLRFTRLGSPSYQALETEQVAVHTRDARTYTGVVQLQNASKHVNEELDTSARNQDTMEILLDELADGKEAVAALGICVGDVVSLDPRLVITPSGFIRSRFLDDKLSAAILLAIAEAVCGGMGLARKVTLHFSVYEEVGHGASQGVPADAEDMLVVDMGCVGDGLTCAETMVSICAMDSTGPYDYHLTTELIELAKANKLQYAVDIYPSYGSDAASAREAGHDLRCALIGPGVYASHGYERSHVQGVENAMKLILAYIGR